MPSEGGSEGDTPRLESPRAAAAAKSLPFDEDSVCASSFALSAPRVTSMNQIPVTPASPSAAAVMVPLPSSTQGESGLSPATLAAAVCALPSQTDVGPSAATVAALVALPSQTDLGSATLLQTRAGMFQTVRMDEEGAERAAPGEVPQGAWGEAASSASGSPAPGSPACPADPPALAPMSPQQVDTPPQSPTDAERRPTAALHRPPSRLQSDAGGSCKLGVQRQETVADLADTTPVARQPPRSPPQALREPSKQRQRSSTRRSGVSPRLRLRSPSGTGPRACRPPPLVRSPSTSPLSPLSAGFPVPLSPVVIEDTGAVHGGEAGTAQSAPTVGAVYLEVAEMDFRAVLWVEQRARRRELRQMAKAEKPLRVHRAEVENRRRRKGLLSSSPKQQQVQQQQRERQLDDTIRELCRLERGVRRAARRSPPSSPPPAILTPRGPEHTALLSPPRPGCQSSPQPAAGARSVPRSAVSGASSWRSPGGYRAHVALPQRPRQSQCSPPPLPPPMLAECKFDDDLWLRNRASFAATTACTLGGIRAFR
eukprot:TRINITY_DN46965_c0_g1_i1.p1 TRINITY_DN46965_c0_g1~~TRINITY_DN46965_c0_g1_i1.p1  ORF type:complete len:570 (+),score=85.77 TRINITY_DN46965_c0_g1_i1:91-1710(+)